MDELVERVAASKRLRDDLLSAIANVSIEQMHGDNLAVTLCSYFCDGTDGDDDTAWSSAGIDGYDATMAAIVDAAIPVMARAIIPLVQAGERERCAKVVEAFERPRMDADDFTFIREAAAAIRQVQP